MNDERVPREIRIQLDEDLEESRAHIRQITDELDLQLDEAETEEAALHAVRAAIADTWNRAYDHARGRTAAAFMEAFEGVDVYIDEPGSPNG